MFARLRRAVRFYERFQLPDVEPRPHEIAHAGAVIAQYPASPAWAVRLPLWGGMRRLGTYAPSTARRKRWLGLPDRYIVLYDTGKLYASIRVLNMKKFYLITAQRDKLSYIIRRFPAQQWLRIDPSAVRSRVAAAVMAALLGCSSLKKNKRVDISVHREEVITHETLRVTTTLNDTVHLRNERIVVHYDTLKQVLRIEQVRPVVTIRDSVVRTQVVVPPSSPPARAGWWREWGRGVFALSLSLSLVAFIAYLWLRALRIR